MFLKEENSFESYQENNIKKPLKFVEKEKEKDNNFKMSFGVP